MKKFFQALDKYLDKSWREFSAFIYHIADKRVEEVDIDWLNMHNDMVNNKKDTQ